MKRVILSTMSAAVLLVSSVGVAAAAPPPDATPGCVAQIVHSFIGPPGVAQSQDHYERFGSWVSHVARAPTASFDDCFAAFLEGMLEPTR